MTAVRFARPLAMVAASVALLGVSACASASRPDAMALPATAGLTASAGDPGYHSVTTVTVAGGADTNPMLSSWVSNGDLKSALEQSLQSAGYMGSEGPAMTVNANLIALEQPMVGLDMTVTSRIRYSVTRNNQVVFDETVAASGTATMGDAVMGMERARLANEKSVQENIKSFLTRLRSALR